MVDPETSFLSISRDVAAKGDYRNSLYWQRAYGALGGTLLEVLASGKLLPEYFQHDYETQLHFQLSERIANWINENLLAQSEGQKLGEILDASPDHGRDHFRRLEKWYKKAQGRDKSLRSDTGYLFFSPSAFLSIKLHDLVESFSGQKEKHDGAGALLALGYVLQSISLANDAVSQFSNGVFTDISLNEWIKIAWGSAFITLHHSKPEFMPSIDELLSRQSQGEDGKSPIGILDPSELIVAAEHMMREANEKRASRQEKTYASLEEFFPPYTLIRPTIDAIREGTIVTPQFNEPELIGLQKQARLFSAADKLDGTYPADLSAVRTFQTRPQRAFFVRVTGEKSLDQELEERIRRGAGYEASCDFDRLLFEITRVSAFNDVSQLVEYWYARGLRLKALFLNSAIINMLDGSSDVFLSAYDHLEKDMVRAILIKAGYGESIVDSIVDTKNKDIRRQEVEQRLISMGFDPRVLDNVLYGIRSERLGTEGIIRAKIAGLQLMDLTTNEKDRIRRLLSLAQERQLAGLRSIPGSAFERLPYDGYRLITLTRLPVNKAIKE